MKSRLLSAVMAVSCWSTPMPAAQIVAHRGASYDAPENTLAATRLAWEQGADAVETDIYLGKDGRIIVHHDKTAKRTAGRDVPVGELTLAEARKLDAGSWKDPKFAGEKIPTLDEQIASIPPGRRLLVEIKVGPEIVGELGRVLRQHGASEKNITVISFNYDALVEVRKQLPQLPTLWLVGHPAPNGKKNPAAKAPPSVDGMIVKAKAAKFTGLDLQHTWPLTAADREKIRAAGLELHVWTVNDADVAKRWIGWGVASITTDRPAWLRAELKR
jgi:glycerophosphoryl diester phosphodiesterase